MTTIDVMVTLEGHLDVSEGSDFRVALEESNGIRYWADEFVVDDYGIRVHVPDEYQPDDIFSGEWDSATWQGIADKVAILASGYFIDYDGQKKRLSNDYVIRAAHDFLFDIDNVDYDVDVMDMIIQMSVLGMVKYG